MTQAYSCPACRRNRQKFTLIYKLAQDITKDPESGETLYGADELETLAREDGSPDIDMRCAACGYSGPESSFIMMSHSPRESYTVERTTKPSLP